MEKTNGGRLKHGSISKGTRVMMIRANETCFGDEDRVQAVYRLDRPQGKGRKCRGGGLITYVNTVHTAHCEPLAHMNAATAHVEAQWIKIHRPNCKNVVICNVYRQPTGELSRLTEYLDECLQSLNLAITEVYVLGDFNVNYQNKTSPDFKKLNFFVKAIGFSQLISNTTRNTDKSKSLIDLVLANARSRHSGS